MTKLSASLLILLVAVTITESRLPSKHLLKNKITIYKQNKYTVESKLMI